MNKAIAAALARDDVQILIDMGVSPTDTVPWTGDDGRTYEVSLLSSTGDVVPKPHACIRWMLEGGAYWRCLDLDEVSLLECAVWERDEQLLSSVCEHASDAPTENNLYRALREANSSWTEGADYLRSRLIEHFPQPDLGTVVRHAFPTDDSFFLFVRDRLDMALRLSSKEEVERVLRMPGRLNSFCTKAIEDRLASKPWVRVGRRLVRH